MGLRIGRISRIGNALPRGDRSGFTLVEVLIVISIIAVLAGLAVVGVQAARKKAHASLATVAVNDLSTALERYVQDEGAYPGQELEPDKDRNDFPLLFNALFGTKRPKGPGGRSAPYMSLKEENVRVLDQDTGEYVVPSRAQRHNPEVKKYLIDPWGKPYVYRPTKGKDLSEYTWFKTPLADIYSIGPDEVDQTILEEEGDDIGNW